MAKNVEHVSHIKSKLKTNGLPQLPTADKLVDGEIAINYAEGVETISIRNENSAITTFSSDNYYTEKKLGSGFTNNDATVTEAIDDLEYMVVNKEEAIAAALNDLNGRKLDASAYTPTDLSNYYTKDETSGKTEISNALGGKVNTATFTGHTADTSLHFSGNEKRNLDALATNIESISGITSNDIANWNAKADKSDIPSVSGYADSVQYNSTTKKVEFYHGTTAGTKVFEYDASPFLIDGMVQNVEIKDVQSGDPAVTVTCLVVSFNTDAGKQDISIPLTDIFDPSSYYDKDDIDDLVGSGFTSSSITEVIIENEEIVSNALNDLDERKLDASAYTPTDLSNYYTKSETSGKTEIANALNDYYTKSQTSGASEIATALNGLNDRKLDVSAYTPTDLSNYYTKSETSGATEIYDLVGSGFTSSSITEVIIENEEIVSNALTDLDERKLDASAYTPTDLSNYYTKSETSGATELTTALASKSDTGHTHASSGVTAMTGYAKAASGSSITTGDTLNQAIGKLEAYVDDLNSQSETIAAALVDLHNKMGDIEDVLATI